MLAGLVAACISGAAFPIAMNVFGDITNLFINHQFSRDVVNSILPPCPLNPTISILNVTGGVVDCNTNYILPGCTFNLSQFISGQVMCLNNEDFISEINLQVYAFMGIAAGSFLFSWIHAWFFQMAAERQTHRIRLLYYRSVLKQNIGWFEENSSGEVSNRLSRYCIHSHSVHDAALHVYLLHYV